MATRKGINTSGNYAAPHITCLVHIICTLYLKPVDPGSSVGTS